MLSPYITYNIDVDGAVSKSLLVFLLPTAQAQTSSNTLHAFD